MTPSISAVARLLLQQSLRSLVRWRSSLSSRVFSMAITAWAAKFVTSSICLSVKGRTSWRKMLIAPINAPSLNIGTTSNRARTRQVWRWTVVRIVPRGYR